MFITTMNQNPFNFVKKEAGQQAKQTKKPRSDEQQTAIDYNILDNKEILIKNDRETYIFIEGTTKDTENEVVLNTNIDNSILYFWNDLYSFDRELYILMVDYIKDFNDQKNNTKILLQKECDKPLKEIITRIDIYKDQNTKLNNILKESFKNRQLTAKSLRILFDQKYKNRAIRQFVRTLFSFRWPTKKEIIDKTINIDGIISDKYLEQNKKCNLLSLFLDANGDTAKEFTKNTNNAKQFDKIVENAESIFTDYINLLTSDNKEDIMYSDEKTTEEAFKEYREKSIFPKHIVVLMGATGITLLAIVLSKEKQEYNVDEEDTAEEDGDYKEETNHVDELEEKLDE